MNYQLEVPAVTKSVVVRPKYPVEVSPEFARDEAGKIVVHTTQAQAGKILKARGCRLMRVGEWKELTGLGIDNPLFSDYRTNPEWLAETARRPTGRKDSYTKIEKDRRFELYTVFVGGKPTVDLWLPQIGFVRAWHDNGLPAETVDKKDHGKGAEIHYYPDYTLNGFAFCADWDWYAGRAACFDLCAHVGPLHSSGDLGFREVRGNVPLCDPTVLNEKTSYDNGYNAGLDTGRSEQKEQDIAQLRKLIEQLQ